MTSEEALSDLSFLAIGDENHTIKCKETIEKDLDQLEEYRKIEEELGIDLITLFKALIQMFVFHKENVKIELIGLHIKSNELYMFGFVEDTVHAVYLSLKDYGKTWALTKEELENDN